MRASAASGSPSSPSSPPLLPHPPSTPRPDVSDLWAIATALGIELPQEKAMLPMVRAAMKAPLPKGWQMHTHRAGGEEPALYYFNTHTGESSWHRPITQEDHDALRLARAAAATTSPVAQQAAHARTTSVDAPASAAPAPSHDHQRTHSSSASTSAIYSGAPSQPSSSSSSTDARAVAPAPVAPNTTRASLPTPAAAAAAPGTQTARPARRRGHESFSLEVQQHLLRSISSTPGGLARVILVQRWFRRWQLRRVAAIRAKLRSSRQTMDAEMRRRLTMGKRRSGEMGTQMAREIMASAAASPASATAPALPTSATSPSSSSSITSGAGPSSTLDPPSSSLITSKKRASMQRMLDLQSRFRADGSVELWAVQQKQLQQAQEEADAQAEAHTTQREAQQANAARDSDRRAARIQRRRTREAEAAQITGAASTPAATASSPTAASSSSSAPAPARSSSPAVPLPFSTAPLPPSPHFLRMLIRMQRLFQARRRERQVRLTAKLERIARRQTAEADVKLRRASLHRKSQEMGRMELALAGVLKNEAAPQRA